MEVDILRRSIKLSFCEVRLKARPVRIFPILNSLLRFITAVILEIREDWITGHRYLATSKNKEAIASV